MLTQAEDGPRTWGKQRSLTKVKHFVPTSHREGVQLIVYEAKNDNLVGLSLADIVVNMVASGILSVYEEEWFLAVAVTQSRVLGFPYLELLSRSSGLR